jgi:hypothetical protein
LILSDFKCLEGGFGAPNATIGKMRPILGLLIALSAQICFSQTSTAKLQDHNFNGWYMYFGDHPFKGKWGLHLEGQWRRYQVITKPQQLLLRPAINYDLNPNVMLTAGYGYITSHRYGDYPAQFPAPEHRIFQQFLLKHNSGKVAFQHRYRLEQRWIGIMQEAPGGGAERVAWRFQNRFRYFFKGVVPLGKTKNFAAFYDEIFLGFGPNIGASIFDQNRAYAAFGRKLTDNNKIEIGYLNQLVAQRNGMVLEVNHTLQFAWFSTVRFGKK